MSDTILVSLIAAGAAIIVAAIGWLRVEHAVKEVHLSVNSRLDELVASKQMVARTEGRDAAVAEALAAANQRAAYKAAEGP